MESPKVYIGIVRPSGGSYTNDFVDSRDYLQANLMRDGLLGGLIQVSSTLIDAGRNLLVEQFLARSRATHLLFLDTDIICAPNACRKLLTHDKDIISGLYFQRGTMQFPLIYSYQGRHRVSGKMCPAFNPILDPVYRYLGKKRLPVSAITYATLEGNDGLMKIGGAGAGFLLVKREVFEKIPYPWFSFERGGEDLYFCDKARKNGFEIWADMSVLLGHLRLGPVGASQFLTQYENTAVANEFLGEEPIARDLARFLHKTPAYIKRKIRDNPALEVAKRWRGKNPQTLDEVRQFYSETSEYLFDLAMWNASDAFKQIINYLPSVEGLKVLDFGGGIGSLSLLLHKRGADVDYLDLPGIVSEFAKFRSNGRINFIDSLADKKEIYDLIVAIDVFEHLPDLPEQLSMLAQAIKPDGVLFFHNNFGQLDLFPHHIDWSQKWPGLLARAGLREEIPGKTAKRREPGVAILTGNINTAPYWDQIWAGEGQDTWRKYPLTFRKIASYIKPEDTVLDVGCGVGVFLDIIRPRCKGAAGLDISPVAIDLLRSKGIDGKVCELPEICHPDKSFDVVVATEIVEHLDDPAALLKEAVRVAREKVIFTVPDNVLGPEEFIEHRQLFTRETLEELVRRFFDDFEIESFTDTFPTPTAIQEGVSLPTLLAICNLKGVTRA
ncbi:Ubiquinone biosynthesis O-methyltransferase, mitochondrial [subsurface metagenome]